MHWRRVTIADWKWPRISCSDLIKERSSWEGCSFVLRLSVMLSFISWILAAYFSIAAVSCLVCALTISLSGLVGRTNWASSVSVIITLAHKIRKSTQSVIDSIICLSPLTFPKIRMINLFLRSVSQDISKIYLRLSVRRIIVIEISLNQLSVKFR